ncbi:DUF1538 domain-containing protein [Caproiciproducens sp. MSJ-32]|uniref:DUF1538 domain-containing protein n=1 Tax=Caproiciproducens sp. MSJ-32 TaxID=2841527 RepID=UPI001C104F34|nr:DUF1538 domain-containing protein [Caproiciproducens sp. MSJ-32]MBU5455089.1 DUF1538 domain-containing protein [Caproiciproducens sp. MSJ-32]
MNLVTEKLKEVLLSVLPITLIVLILNFTITPVEKPLLLRFLIGAVFVIIGLSIFLAGVDIGITPIGNVMGSTLTKTNKVSIVIIAGLVLGFFISVAEPDLQILGAQVSFVTSGMVSKWLIVIIVSIGIAVMLALGLGRILYNIPLYKLLTIIYGIILLLSIFTSPEFLAISFDASGATTGALTVPFMLALSLGVSHLKKDSKSSEKDSFGLVAIASSGAIIAVMIMSILSKIDRITATLEIDTEVSASIIEPFIKEIPKISFEIMLALLPILIIFLIFQKIKFKLSKKSVRKILFGIFFTFIGLVIFLVGVNAGFMELGTVLGYKVASLENKTYLVITGFALGFVTILAEPAVYVLTHQIEDVTSGYVKRKIVLFALSIGVGFAVALSMLRIMIPQIQLWHYLLPGYIISILMSYYVPKLFVGMAFDSGGVASGPMTATFILAFAQGAADAIECADVLIDGFGMISMVAMTPIIALQILGFIFKVKSIKGGVENNVG